MARVACALVVFTLTMILAESAWSDDALSQSGRRIAEINCARCHSIKKSGESPFRPAPPFRVIARIYKASDLEEALVEGIVVGHPAMPEFRMSSEQATALSSFIDSLA